MKLFLFLSLFLISASSVASVEKNCERYVESDSSEIKLVMCRSDLKLETDVFISQNCLSKSCMAFNAYLKAPKTRLGSDQRAPDVNSGYAMCVKLKGIPLYIKLETSVGDERLVCKFQDKSYIGLTYINPDYI